MERTQHVMLAGGGADAFAETLARLRRHEGLETQLLFLDCDTEVLIRRYTETRRRHPLAGDRPAADGIAIERRLLTPVRALAACGSGGRSFSGGSGGEQAVSNSAQHSNVRSIAAVSCLAAGMLRHVA